MYIFAFIIQTQLWYLTLAFFETHILLNLNWGVMKVKLLFLVLFAIIWDVHSGHNVMNSFSFASFDRYLEKSQVSKKVNGGFSINLGLFTIGHKRKMTEIFSSTVTNNTQGVFGELNVAIDQNVYEM